jgi:hypothetical protein
MNDRLLKSASEMKLLPRPVNNLFRFYYDGFITMSDWGRKVWTIIIIKLIIIFAILRLFFFHDFLQREFDNDKLRSEYVLDQLTFSTDTDD